MERVQLYVKGVPDWVEEAELRSKLTECAGGEPEVQVSDVQWLQRYSSVHLAFHGTSQQLETCCRALNGTKWGADQPLRVLRANEDYQHKLQREWEDERKALARQRDRKIQVLDSAEMVLPRKVSRALANCTKTTHFWGPEPTVKDSSQLTWRMGAPPSRPEPEPSTDPVPQPMQVQSATQTALSFLGVGQMTDARRALSKRIRTGLRKEDDTNEISVADETTRSLAVLAEIVPETMNLVHNTFSNDRQLPPGRWRTLGLHRSAVDIPNTGLVLPLRINLQDVSMTSKSQHEPVSQDHEMDVAEVAKGPGAQGRWRTDLLKDELVLQRRDEIVPRRAACEIKPEKNHREPNGPSTARSSFAFNF